MTILLDHVGSCHVAIQGNQCHCITTACIQHTCSFKWKASGLERRGVKTLDTICYVLPTSILCIWILLKIKFHTWLMVRASLSSIMLLIRLFGLNARDTRVDQWLGYSASSLFYSKISVFVSSKQLKFQTWAHSQKQLFCTFSAAGCIALVSIMYCILATSL